LPRGAASVQRDSAEPLNYAPSVRVSANVGAAFGAMRGDVGAGVGVALRKESRGCLV
jgi:hypothetical protein